MDSCEECGANEISAATGATSCTACGGGTVANGDHTACGKQNRIINNNIIRSYLCKL